MSKIRLSLLVIIAALLLCSCGAIKVADKLLDFSSDDNGVIMFGEVEYSCYGIIEKTDLTEQIGIVDGDKNDRIYTYRNYSAEDFIANMYNSGEMDVPMLYRAVGCDIEPEGVYIPDDDEDDAELDVPSSYQTDGRE